MNLKQQFVNKYDQGGPLPAQNQDYSTASNLASRRREAFKKHSSQPSQMQQAMLQRQKNNTSAINSVLQYEKPLQ